MAEVGAISSHIIVTTFAGPQDGPNQSVPPADIVAACKRHGFAAVEVVADPQQAYKALLARPEPVKLVTGSFYLLNHIRALLEQAPEPAVPSPGDR